MTICYYCAWDDGNFVASGLKNAKKRVRLPIDRFIAAVSLPQSHLFQYLQSGKKGTKPFSLDEKRLMAYLVHVSKYSLKKIPYKKVQAICKHNAWKIIVFF